MAREEDLCVCMCVGGQVECAALRGQRAGVWGICPKVTVDTWPRTHDGDHDVLLFNGRKMRVYLWRETGYCEHTLCVYFTGKLDSEKIVKSDILTGLSHS